MSTGRLLVAAIDFGTTFSGYAFSLAHEFQSDPLKIQTNHWIGGGHISLKAPTTVLFDPGKVFHSFGYAAEDKYSDLADDDDHKQWYYFRRFKMLLHDNNHLSRHTYIKEELGKTLPAITVFSSAIRYLKDHLMEELRKRVPDVEEKDINWVLTVPAIWNESAKQFMREAGTEAGIQGNQLTLALEPEAASVLCKLLPVEKLYGARSNDLCSFSPGSSYMVLDLGGGTVDITVHSVESDGSLAEIAKASGGAWGGTQVDDEFLGLLQEVLGKQTMDELRQDNTADFLDLMREFEAKKRSISGKTTGTVTLRIPAVLNEIFKRQKKRNMSDHVKTTRFSGRLEFKRDKMVIDAEIVKGFFRKSISNTIMHVQAILVENEFQNIHTVLMVGGFAESEIVQEQVRATLCDKRVITPNESGLVVLKGAVLYGHNPKVVKARISKYTYGVEVHYPFMEGVHPEEYKFFDGIYKARYTFDPYVRAGETVPEDSIVQKAYTTNIIDVTEGVGISLILSKSGQLRKKNMRKSTSFSALIDIIFLFEYIFSQELQVFVNIIHLFFLLLMCFPETVCIKINLIFN